MGFFNVTVKGGFWPANGVNSFQGVSGEAGQRRRVAQIFGTKGHLAIREVAYVLVGAAPGATATKNYAAVAPAVELGGKRPIETQVLVNRATTANDASVFKNEYLRFSTETTFGPNPPVNRDRNPLGTR